MNLDELEFWESGSNNSNGVVREVDFSDLPEDSKIYNLDGVEIEDCFDPRKLIKYPRHGVAFWDETHPEVVIGSVKNKQKGKEQVQVRFPQN